MRALVFLAVLLLPLPALAQAAVKPAERSDLFPPAAAAATAGGAVGYAIGLKWRFLGSTPDQARHREAPALGLVLGGVSSGIAACAATEDPHVTIKRCLDGAVIGAVPATILAGAVSWKAPRWLQPVLALAVFGLVEGGFTAWSATR